MRINYKRWQSLFLFCLGLFGGTAFCMKWMEGDFWSPLIDGSQKFTVIGLEISYSKAKVATILAGLDGHVKSILRYHLYFDFAFMAGVYPGITSLCIMAREKSRSSLLKKILLVLAAFQTIAWGCDIAENYFLLKWIKNPVIGNEFGIFHFIVAAKWIIALGGALIAIPLALKKRKIM